MIDVEKTIQSEYGNSAVITQLIHNMNAYIDPRANIDAFYNVVWNVDTAEGFGLDIWGRIVGLPTGRNIYTNPVTVLNDDQFRRLVFVKALSNISRTTSGTFNTLMNNLFPGRGRCYVSDQGNMQMRYTFEFSLLPWEIQVMKQPGILLRPAGVQVSLVILTFPCFGFSEANSNKYTGFNQAPFEPSEILT